MSELRLEDGARVAVIGGGPAGSFFAYFLLEMAQRAGLDIEVDIHEPRDFSQPAPFGCNMCGGIISESLVQALAAEGILLPPTIVQRAIDSYVLHMDVGSVRIGTPLQEKRIGAVYRGGGPRDIKEAKWGSFDDHLLMMAQTKGANLVRRRVGDVKWRGGRPRVGIGDDAETYDLLAVAVGINSASLKMFEGYEAPRSTKTFIREYYLGEDQVERVVGSAMHVFLLDLPRLEFGAIVPKGDYVTVCLLGEDIDNALVKSFLESREVRECLAPYSLPDERSCQCAPRMNIGGAAQPYADRVVFVGDCAVTRLFKDGIGAAYRTAKAAARTAVFEGISADAFREFYRPTCRSISHDNAIGERTFAMSHRIQHWRFARRAILRMTASEQRLDGRRRRMSQALWDLFTGSASYKAVAVGMLHPAFWGRLIWHMALGLVWRRTP